MKLLANHSALFLIVINVVILITVVIYLRKKVDVIVLMSLRSGVYVDTSSPSFSLLKNNKLLINSLDIFAKHISEFI